MYKKLLVASDGSQGSQIAVVHAAVLAKKLNAQLSALWVRAYLPHYLESIGEVAEEEEAALEFYEEIKTQLGSVSTAQGITIQPNMRSGHPAHQIVAFAAASDVDLVVLGSRGHSRLSGELLGHTADRVNERAGCSVLIVRSKLEAPRYRRMLIGYDGSDASERALRQGVALAKQIGSEVEILWVDEAELTRRTETELRDYERRAREFFESLRIRIDAAAVEQGLEVRAGFRRGNAARILVSEAEAGGFRLIVLGHRGRSGLWGRLLGGVADRVSHHAQCDVLIVR
jgi:nucleotide-binding universal stress UspA family protein